MNTYRKLMLTVRYNNNKVYSSAIGSEKQGLYLQKVSDLKMMFYGTKLYSAILEGLKY